jgi:hypothetical protein
VGRWVLTETRTRVVEAESEAEAIAHGVIEEAALWESRDMQAEPLEPPKGYTPLTEAEMEENRRTVDTADKWRDRRNWGNSYARGYRR